MRVDCPPPPTPSTRLSFERVPCNRRFARVCGRLSVTAPRLCAVTWAISAEIAADVSWPSQISADSLFNREFSARICI